MDEILDRMEELGFYRNDAQVYLALLRGKSNPTTISDHTHIARPRVYDALDRLVEQGCCIKDETEKRPRYFPIDPDVVIADIQQRLTAQLDLAKSLGSPLRQQTQRQPHRMCFGYIEKTALRAIFELIAGADQLVRLYLPKFREDLLDRVLQKMGTTSDPLPAIHLILPTEKEVPSLELGEVSHWHPETDLPFGLIQNDTGTILLIFRAHCLYLHDIRDMRPYNALFQLIQMNATPDSPKP